MDDYAINTELLCHTVTQRRLGFLGCGPFDPVVIRQALNQPIIAAKHILH